jgi:hypothetical protein
VNINYPIFSRTLFSHIIAVNSPRIGSQRLWAPILNALRDWYQPFFKANFSQKMIKKWGGWHMFVDIWDGMRPKSPNSIHRACPCCHIPRVLALSGASCYLPNLIWFGPHSLPPAMKTLPSRRLASTSSPLTVVEGLVVANISLLHRSPSLTSFLLYCSLSSPFTTSSFNASHQLQLLVQLLNIAWIILQCLAPCTSHHIEAQL